MAGSASGPAVSDRSCSRTRAHVAGPAAMNALSDGCVEERGILLERPVGCQLREVEHAVAQPRAHPRALARAPEDPVGQVLGAEPGHGGMMP